MLNHFTSSHARLSTDARRGDGLGHVYQQRYKSFSVQDDDPFLVVCRYVERNALRAGLVERAEQWRWGSLWRWLQNWTDRVNEPRSDKELEAVRKCANRGGPLGDEAWVESTTRRLGLESTLRPRGRPKIDKKEA